MLTLLAVAVSASFSQENFYVLPCVDKKGVEVAFQLNGTGVPASAYLSHGRSNDSVTTCTLLPSRRRWLLCVERDGARRGRSHHCARQQGSLDRLPRGQCRGHCRQNACIKHEHMQCVAISFHHGDHYRPARDSTGQQTGIQGAHICCG